MIIQRSLVLAIILSLITCVIYAIYWFIVLTNDVGKLSGDHEFTSRQDALIATR
jgi:hypothetical protein